MNILVTGANGQLGNEMRILAEQQKLTAQGSQLKAHFIFTDVSQVEGFETTYLDITDLEAIRTMVKEHNINAIVNCAAWTNVDAAEDSEKYELVEKLNATAPENLAKAMKEVNGLLVHISTDYVFGGEPYNTPCKEDQTGTPTGVYGRTKLQGEQNIINVAIGNKQSAMNSHPIAHCPQLSYVIIRTAWLYSEFGKNFCKTMLNLTATKPALKVVYDQCGTPTYALDLAKAIFTIIEDYQKESYASTSQRLNVSTNSYSKSGVYHYSNEGVTSWYDFTQMIAKIAGNTDCDIQPCYSSEYPSPVKRPSYSVLDKRTFKETFGVKVPYWVDSLELCIKNIINHKYEA